MDYVCNLSNTNRLPDKMMDSIDKNVMKERLDIIEKEQGLTSTMIADELGILRNTYSQYKNEKYPNIIQTLMLKKIASKYNYSMDWIVGRSNHRKLQ